MLGYAMKNQGNAYGSLHATLAETSERCSGSIICQIRLWKTKYSRRKADEIVWFRYIEWTLQVRARTWTKNKARLPLVCSVARYSELSLLLVRYVQNDDTRYP